MDYTNIFSKNLPSSIELPDGLLAQTKYVFSITFSDPDTFPSDDLSEAMRIAMNREGQDLTQYPPPQGHEGLRNLISQNLHNKRGIQTSIDSIFLSSGAGGAIQSILDAFIDPGDVVLAEEFTYLGTLRMILERNAQVIHIPTDQQGMDTEILEQIVKKMADRGSPPKLIHCISVYQNPMGMTLNLERRRHMLDISHRYGVPILENESYADFRIDGPELPPAMVGMDTHDSVMYVSAYTKILGCGLRLGYGVVPDSVKDKLADLRFGGSPSHLAAMTIYEYLMNKGEEHISQVRTSLKAKRDAMLTALDDHFPPTCTWSKPNGGMMIWVRLPDGADTWKALDKAIEADIKYTPGATFRANRDCNNYLRLTYSYNTPEEIHEGIARLAQVFKENGLLDL